MNAIGIRMVPVIRQWPEHLKASRAGKLMMWGVGWSRRSRRRGRSWRSGYGPNKGQANHARFDLPAFNALYERQRVLPDGARARGAVRRGQAADGRLHAVQGARAPHLDRPVAAVGHRLSPQRVRARVLEVRRRRHGRARAQGASNEPSAAPIAGVCCTAAVAAVVAGWRARLPAPAPAHCRAQGAAAAVQLGRDQLRPGAHLRSVLARRHRPHLRGALRLRPCWRGRSSCGR